MSVKHSVLKCTYLTPEGKFSLLCPSEVMQKIFSFENNYKCNGTHMNEITEKNRIS